MTVPGIFSIKYITLATQPLNWLTGDVLLDVDDLDLLNSGLIVVNNPSDPDIAKRRSVFEWMDHVGNGLGTKYVSFVKRYYKKN